MGIKMRDEKIDILRGIAIILVVYGHVIQILYYNTDLDFFQDNVQKFICSFHMPLFAVISGYLFFNSCVNKSIKQVLCKKIPSLMFPLFLWNTIYYFFYKILIYIFSDTFKINFWEWWEVFTGPFLWFLWSIIACTVTFVIISKSGKLQWFLIIALYFAMYLFPNSEYNLYIYPYFAGGYLCNQYKIKLTKIFNTNAIYIIWVIFAAMSVFYDKEHYIYTTGISIMKSEFSWKHQLYINIFRYIIGIIGVLSMIVFVGKTHVYFPDKIKKVFAFCGNKSLQVYILQCVLVSWLFSMFYQKFIKESFTELLGNNIWLLDFVFAPVITFAFMGGIILIIKFISKNQYLQRFLFYR